MNMYSQTPERPYMETDDPSRGSSSECEHDEKDLTYATLRQSQSHHRTKTAIWRRLVTTVCSRSFFAVAISLVAFVVALGSSSGLITLPSRSGHGYRTTNLGNCGSTWQEAEQNGCVFDVMATDWVRSECKQKTLSDALFEQGNWTFYRDVEGREPLSHEELLTGRVSPYYTEGSYQFAHCSYVWHKQLRQMGKHPMLLDSKSRNWPHSMHCLYMMAEADTNYISDSTSSKTVLGKTKSGDSVDCIAGEWEPPAKSLAYYMKEISRGNGHSE